jgi:NAD(P)-dependent dehydrogenase (short-subunit alcohol dehydrogenase family)
MNDQKVVIVTGSSSGIGLESALLLGRNGYITYATMRSPERDTSIKEAVQNESLPIRAIRLDVNDDSSVKNAVNHIISEAGRIDVRSDILFFELDYALNKFKVAKYRLDSWTA